MATDSPLSTLLSSEHNPLTTLTQGGGFFESNSFLSQFFTGSMFFGSSFNASSPFGGTGNNGSMIWNSTMTDQYIHKGLESLVLVCFPSFVVQSALFQFFISFMFSFMTSNNIFTAGIALVVFGKVWTYVVNKLEEIYYYIRDIFNYSVEVKEKENYKFNTIYVCLMHWLGTVEHFQNAKHLTVHAKNDLSNNHRHNEEDNENDLVLQLVPGPGSHGFYFKGHKITIQRIDPSFEKDKNGDKEDTTKLVLTVSAWNGKEILKNILQEAIECYFQSEKGVTSVYTLSTDYYRDWEKLCDRPYRSFDTVYLEEDIKQNLIKDMDRFMSNEIFYRENSLNYQRGYLCYGPPGSGKSSLVLAMAAKLKCCLFSVSLNDKSLDDSKLQKMLTKLPKRGIVLLEDIDAAFNENRKASADVQGVSFSGLLNALDGVASFSQFPRIIFMTTNHIDRLDPALVRPGRIDFKIKFENSTKDQIRQMAARFFKDEELGAKISELIPEHKLTTAEVQTYLMRYIYEKEDCLNHVEEYLVEVDNLRKEFEKKKLEEEKEDDDKSTTSDNAKDKSDEIKIEEEKK